ncbi:hypothetical protein TW85_24970 [Marinomonas sp. S3726]|uniref:GNAT family N-acetyltransferase n=1 Tax=Marinomonas sp. S3726 TaxID=579484 RepID=UPI0005F9EF65|nr:GNAT family N-acetyltransferase [Marinomonas sp. S3726]KJZ06826.1 hypothetical protein TW85_24970 [Marinomonas sp. S3726]
MFHFRKASVEDVTQIALIHVTNWSEAYQGLMPEAYIQGYNLERREKLWHKIISESLAEVLVFEVLSEKQTSLLVGFLSYEKVYVCESQLNRCFSLSSLYVIPKYQGFGIGRCLYQAFEEKLLASVGSASAEVRLWCLDSNLSTLNFYRYMVFYETDKQVKEESPGACLIDLEMAKVLVYQEMEGERF